MNKISSYNDIVEDLIEDLSEDLTYEHDQAINFLIDVQDRLNEFDGDYDKLMMFILEYDWLS